MANRAIYAATSQYKRELEKQEFEEKLKNSQMVTNNISALAGMLSQINEQNIQSIKVDADAQKAKAEELASMSQQERAAYEQRKKFALKLFKFEQAAALAQVGFNTAEAVTKALAYPPVLRGVMIATATAMGMAQAALIAGKQPPSFHNGGMAPDETPAKLLKGEAVLDRATVRNMGGEQGIKQMQQNNTVKNEVIVIQPFKHFGRYTREIGFKAPKNTGIKA
jgi:hypothetical protein